MKINFRPAIANALELTQMLGFGEFIVIHNPFTIRIMSYRKGRWDQVISARHSSHLSFDAGRGNELRLPSHGSGRRFINAYGVRPRPEGPVSWKIYPCYSQRYNHLRASRFRFAEIALRPIHMDKTEGLADSLRPGAPTNATGHEKIRPSNHLGGGDTSHRTTGLPGAG